MVKIETIFKMSLTTGITIFTLYMVYKFMRSQGWLARAQTVTMKAEPVIMF